MTHLGRPTGLQGKSIAAAVSANGSVVVGWEAEEVQLQDVIYTAIRPYRWTAAGGRERLRLLPDDEDYPRGQGFGRAVSADGSVVVGSSYHDSTVGTRAVRWTSAGQMMSLGRLPGDYGSSAEAVSADGAIIVGRSWRIVPDEEDYLVTTPFIWDEVGGMRSLSDELSAHGVDMSGWNLGTTDFLAMSADGSTVIGATAGVWSQGWVVTVPEPAMLPWLGLTGLLLHRPARAGRVLSPRRRRSRNARW